MSSFDLTPHFAEGLAESQQGEGGWNSAMNCVPDSVTLSLMALGYREVEPQTITDALYGRTYRGGESFEAMIPWVHANVDGALAMSVEHGDVLAILDAFGPQRFPMVFMGRCLADGSYTTKLSQYEHASCVLRRGPGWTVLLNSERGLEVGYADDTLRQIYSGSVLVFHKPIPGAPSPAPIPPSLTEDDPMPGFTHSNGTRHSAFIVPDTAPDVGRRGDLMHQVWNTAATRPELAHVGSGKAHKITDFFEEQGTGRVILSVVGMDDLEYYEFTSSATDDLSADLTAGWVQR